MHGRAGRLDMKARVNAGGHAVRAALDLDGRRVKADRRQVRRFGETADRAAAPRLVGERDHVTVPADHGGARLGGLVAHHVTRFRSSSMTCRPTIWPTWT